jgi:hypothetical protein
MRSRSKNRSFTQNFEVCLNIRVSLESRSLIYGGSFSENIRNSKNPQHNVFPIFPFTHCLQSKFTENFVTPDCEHHKVMTKIRDKLFTWYWNGPQSFRITKFLYRNSYNSVICLGHITKNRLSNCSNGIWDTN